MANVRHATPDDIDRLIDLGAAMHAESPQFSPYPFLPDRLRTSLETVLAMPMGCILVAEQGGDLVGGFVALAGHHYACGFIQACDLAWFVCPAHRGGSAGMRLVRAYLNWAKSIGAEASIGLNTGVEPERTGQLLAALGAHQSGTTWTWGN
jgi:GNAT superfamily N-acetyltransferase